MSSSELALEAAETALDISAPDSPSSSSQALPLTANSSRCNSPQFSPPQFLNEEDDDEEAEGEGVDGEEVDEGEEDLQNLQNLQELQEAAETPMESEAAALSEDDDNVTSLNLSLKAKPVDDITDASNTEQHQQEQELLDSINNSGNCSSRSSSCSRSSSNASPKQQQQQDQHEENEQQTPSASPPPPPPPLPADLTVVSSSSSNNHNSFNQFAGENHDLPSSGGGISIGNNLSASALAAAAAFRVGHNNSSNNHKSFHHKAESSTGISRAGKSSKSHFNSGSGSGNQLSYAADYSSVPNPQSPDFVQLLLEYRQVLLDMLAKSITLNTDADYTAVGGGGDPKSVNLPLKCQCGFTSKLSNQITRSSTYVHQLELRFRSLMEASRATEAKYTPKRPNFINSASQAFAVGTGAAVSKGSLLDKKAAHQLSRQAASASAAAVAAASAAVGGGGGKPVSLFAGRSGASSINSSLNGDDDEGDADSEEDDVNEQEDNLPGSLNLANFNGAIGSLVEEMNGAGNDGSASGNAGGKTILEGYLKSMKNHLPSEDGGSEDEDAGKMMMANQMGGGAGAEDNEFDGKRIDLQTKRLIVQMINSGIGVSDISRNIGVSRKAVKQIVANYRAYGMLEKKRESRIQKGMQSLVIKLYAQGRSFSEISRATNISKPTISKIIKQFAESKGFLVQHNGSDSASAMPNMKPHVEMQHFATGDALDDDMDDEEKEMVVDEDAGDEDDFDDEDEEMAMKNAHLMDGPSMHSAGSAFPLALTKQQPHQPPMKKQRTAMSLIHNSFNNGNSGNVLGGAFNLHAQQSPQQAHMNSNGNSSQQHQQQQLLQSQLSLLQERMNNNGKAFDMKMRHSNHGGLPMMDLLSQSQHGHRKSSHIVPQAQDNTAKLQAILRHQQQQQKHQQLQQQQQQQQHHMRMNSSSPRGENHHRMKSMSNNHREMSIKESLMSMPEADKNNNTTLANCNTMTISATGGGAPGQLTLNGNALAAMGGHLSNSSSGQHSPSESNALLPSMNASMGDSNSDSEGNNMMARPFVDGFPAGIMNSLNPNRATKLTLEDFNVVWQLRSQHWTHNQIRKYFEQRGKSISKSSISRIMNGKQRNFQQFFNVIPSAL